jgi:hypothetical protein
MPPLPGASRSDARSPIFIARSQRLCPCSRGKKRKDRRGAAGVSLSAQALERTRALLLAGRTAEAEPFLRRMATKYSQDAAV